MAATSFDSTGPYEKDPRAQARGSFVCPLERDSKAELVGVVEEALHRAAGVVELHVRRADLELEAGAERRAVVDVEVRVRHVAVVARPQRDAVLEHELPADTEVVRRE